MDFIYWPIFVFFSLMVLSILISPLARRLGAPILLFLLGLGAFASQFPSFFFLNAIQDPHIIFFITAPALSLILFDSGFQTSFLQNKLYLLPAGLLASLGVLLSVLFLTPFAVFLLDLSFLKAFLLCSLIASTDAPAVFLLLRHKDIYLNNNVKSTLEIESGSNDPMAIFLTLTCVALLIYPFEKSLLFDGSFLFLKQLIIGGVGGYLLFLLMRFLLNFIQLEQPLYPLLIFALILSGFALISLGGGSGYFSVYLSGLILGNSCIRAKSGILKFQQSLSYFAQILMFLSLGLFVSFDELKAVLTGGVLLGLALIFIVRPLMVFLILIPFKRYSFKDKCFISFVGLRGATSLLLALILVFYQVEEAVFFFHIIFVMVLLSLIIQGFLIKPVAILFKTRKKLSVPPAVKESIDLPGLRNSFLMMYELSETSGVMMGDIVPSYAQPILLIRDRIIYQGDEIHYFKTGDKVYVFVENEKTLYLFNQLYGDKGDIDPI